jgi:hypothetical protein
MFGVDNMSRHWKPVYHPQRRRIPPEYRRIPTYRRWRTIGEERGGIFDCWEYTYYYVYVSEDMPSSDRFFEVRVRIALRKWQSPKMIEKAIAAKVDEIMANKGIDVNNFDKKSVGIRKVGITKSKSARYVLINKQTKQCWPKSGWGLL